MLLAAKSDEEQCVRRLICEVNARGSHSDSHQERSVRFVYNIGGRNKLRINHRKKYSAKILQILETVLMDMLGDSGSFPEFDAAAEVGKRSRSGPEECKTIFARCPLSSQEVASKVLS